MRKQSVEYLLLTIFRSLALRSLAANQRHGDLAVEILLTEFLERDALALCFCLALGFLITGLPKIGGRIDWGMAVRAAAQHPAVCKQAAREHLDGLVNRVRQKIAADMVHMPSLQRQVARQHPAVAAMADTGTCTEGALRDMFPQFSK
jgi:hypothetical protein